MQDNQFPVSVIMESKPSSSPWLKLAWEAIGVCKLAEDTEKVDEVRIIKHGDVEQHIYQPLRLRLFRDECESYYHNLMSPKPGCFVIARENEHDIPVPFLVSMCFDEAHAYQEGDDLIYRVPIPPELYSYLEAYVIEHYMPIKKKKRKRVNWKDAS